MTDYEILSLYTEYAQLFTTMITVYITLLFAYLVASFIAAARLTRLQFWLVTVLYLLVSFDVAHGIRVHGNRAATLNAEIVQRVDASGSEIAFLSTAGMPEWLPNVVFVFYLLTALVAVLFAMRVRKGGT